MMTAPNHLGYKQYNIVENAITIIFFIFSSSALIMAVNL